MKAKYFNFPLISLAYGTSEKQRVETLVMWAIIDVGRKSLAALIELVKEEEGHKWEAMARLRALNFKHDLNLLFEDEEGMELDALDAKADDLEEALKCAEDYNRLIWALGVETLNLNHSHPIGLGDRPVGLG